LLENSLSFTEMELKRFHYLIEPQLAIWLLSMVLQWDFSQLIA